jgi:adenylyltransferase/sulfurtransferase
VLGVFAPLTGIIGCMQAAEAIRLLALSTPPPEGEVVLFDVLEMETQRLPVLRNPACAVCGSRPGTAPKS